MKKLSIEARILIVEDEDLVAQGLRRTLQKGYGELPSQIFSAKSLAETSKLLAQETFDLIFLDFALPDGFSHTLATENIIPKESRIILMSAHQLIPDLLDMFQVQWRTVEIKKPFTHDILDHALAQLDFLPLAEAGK